MDPTIIYSDLFQRLQRHFGLVLKDLRADDLDWRPTSEANSVGFLLWHLLRTWDGYFCFVDGNAETYVAEHWAEKFGFDASGRGVEGSGTGTGFNSEDVEIIRPQPAHLNGFLESLVARTTRYLRAAAPADYDRVVIVPWWPDPATAGRILLHITIHSLEHVGEAQYARGLATSRARLQKP